MATNLQVTGSHNPQEQLAPGAHHQAQASGQFYQSAGSQKSQAVVVATIGGGSTSGAANHQRKLANTNMNQLNQ